MTLRLTRAVPAPRDAVFRAWTDPEALRRWWAPAEGMSLPAAEVDLRPGGRYRFTMRNAKGEEFHLTGVYREVRPPERLVYTWRWEGTERDGDGETLVVVESAEGRRELRRGRTVDGVPDRRPVDGDDGDVVLRLE